jgi:arylsulfatase A-like enzyme
MTTEQHNILLIIVDCLRADYVYEPGQAYIPSLTSLRAEGFSFLNTISVTSTTTPSLTSLLTGLYPFEHGARSLSGYTAKTGTVTFPEILREAGYHTYAEVTGPLVEQMGFAQFFEHYIYREPASTIHAEWGEELLERFKRRYQTPWFVLLHIWSLHKPRVVIEECSNSRFGRTPYARALSSIDHYLGKLIPWLGDDTLVAITGDHGEQFAKSGLDALYRRVGRRVYRTLRRRKLTNLHFAKGMRRFHEGHGYGVYDVLVKVPLIFRHPGIVPPGESHCQIRLIDLFPTILDLVGVEHGLHVTGASTRSMMEGREATHRDAYLEAVGHMIPNPEEWLAGIRVDNKYKYIFAPFQEDFEEELYDLEVDPSEKRNIARQRQDVVSVLRAKIEALQTMEGQGEEIDEEDQQEVVDRLRALGYVD